MRKQVYNLEFRSWCPEMTIFGYRFGRVDDYASKVARLQHLIPVTSEFAVDANNGEHAITAYVDIPEREESAILEWRDSGTTALNDIVLLLSLFTGRNVFAVDNEHLNDTHNVILADPRIYQWGGVLGVSIPYRKQPIEPEPYSYNIGFEEGLNQIYSLIRSTTWQRKYHKGYFLFLARQAFHHQTLESAFIQCWTIWEHLFTILNDKWLSDEEIRRLRSFHKVAFLLVEYALEGEINELSRKRIKSLADIRNRLVHFGRFPEQSLVHEDAELFIRLTEFIIAKILGLSPSNLFNTMERLEEFLNQRQSSLRHAPDGV